MPDAPTHRRRRHPDEIAPRPSPLHPASMANADEFLQNGDFGLSVGEGHFPARVIQRVTGSPYVHVLGIYRAAGVWRICESTPPCVRVRTLAELVAENSGLYDVWRIQPGLCDLDAAWAWAIRAEGVKYSYRDLWLVWRRRYRAAVARGECTPFAFPSLVQFAESHNDGFLVNPRESDPHWNPDASVVATDAVYPGRIPDPVPNSGLPDGCKRDCSALWGAALRVNGLVPPLMEFDCDVVPGDFSVPGRFEYVATLTK